MCFVAGVENVWIEFIPAIETAVWNSLIERFPKSEFYPIRQTDTM
jgi:hypothetical protein